MVEPSRLTVSNSVERRGDIAPVEQSKALEYGTNINPVERAAGVAPVEAVSPQTVSAPAPVRDERYLQIERLLESDLLPLYQTMSLADQMAFKVKGEETVIKIQQVLAKPKISIGQIIDLIRDWLKLIPGVNKFFIEQEAKIKADRLVAGVDHDRLKA